mgnify:CR=1 FL=1
MCNIYAYISIPKRGVAGSFGLEIVQNAFGFTPDRVFLAEQNPTVNFLLRQIIACLTLSLSVCTAWAQVNTRPLQVGVGLASHRYQGDLTHQEDNPWRMYPGLSVSLQFESTRRLQVALEGGFGKFIEQVDRLSGFPPHGPANGMVQPNRFVETNFFYTELRLRLRILKQGPWQPYLGTGAGLLFFTPLDQQGNFLSDNLLTRQPNETYGTFAPQLPLSVGLRWQMSPRLGLEGEYSFRLLGSDYLDNQGDLGLHSGNDRLHQLRLSVVLTLNGEAPAIPEPPTPVVPSPPLIAEFSAEYWLQLYPELADSPPPPRGVEHTRFRSVRPQAATRQVALEQEMSWEELSQQLQRPVRLLRSLNPQLVAPLAAGTEVRLP